MMMAIHSMIFKENIVQEYIDAFQRYYTRIMLGDNVVLGSDLVNDK